MVCGLPASPAARVIAPAAAVATARVRDAGFGFPTTMTNDKAPPAAGLAPAGASVANGRGSGTGGHAGAVMKDGRGGDGATRAKQGQDTLAEPVGLLEVRVPGQDELLDAQRGVLLDQVGDLIVAAHQRGAGGAADEADAGPQMRVDLEPPGGPAGLVPGVQRHHPLLADRLALGQDPLGELDLLGIQVAEQPARLGPGPRPRGPPGRPPPR